MLILSQDGGTDRDLPPPPGQVGPTANTLTVFTTSFQLIMLIINIARTVTVLPVPSMGNIANTISVLAVPFMCNIASVLAVPFWVILTVFLLYPSSVMPIL